MGNTSTTVRKPKIYKMAIKCTKTHLPCYRNFWTILIAERTPTPIRIIEHHRHGGLSNPSLALLIDQLLEIGSQSLPQIGNAQHKADGVKNVGLAGTIKAGDGIEVGIEARDDRASGVGFEALQADLFYVHFIFVLLFPFIASLLLFTFP